MRSQPTVSSIALAATLSRSLGFRIERPRAPQCPSVPSSLPLRYSNWDAFEIENELSIGFPRYEMVALPDSMVRTTLYVGNLGEFVTDDELSEAFAQVSSLGFVPACVARKPNMESLRYGFVAFRSEEEKEAARELMHGQELQGRRLRVEPIKDHDKYGRVRAPQKIVAYAVGPIKRRRNDSSASTKGGDGCNGVNGERRRSRPRKKRRTRGRYKNQQRKNSRAILPMM